MKDGFLKSIQNIGTIATVRMDRPKVNPLYVVLGLAALLLLLHYGIGLAQAETSAARPGIVFRATLASTLMMGVGEFVRAAMQTGLQIAASLMPEARTLLIATSGLMLSWYAITWILGGDLEDIIKGFVMFVLLWGLAKYGLDTYSQLVGLIDGGFNQVMKIIGVNIPEYLTSLMKAAGMPFAHLNETLGKLSVMEAVRNIFPLLVSYLAALFIAVIIFIAGLVIAGMIAVSQVMIAVAAALGPIMIPFLILPPLSYIATGWLRYTIFAGFIKLVGSVIVKFLSLAVVSLFNLTYVVSQDGAPVFYWNNLITAVFILGLSAILSLYVMEIATGLVGGVPLRGVIQLGGRTASNAWSSFTGAIRGFRHGMKK